MKMKNSHNREQLACNGVKANQQKESCMAGVLIKWNREMEESDNWIFSFAINLTFHDHN